MKHNKISNIIKQKRNLNKLSQKELAEKLNVSEKTISRWELGKSCPKQENIDKMSEIFNVSMEKLMNKKFNNKVILSVIVIFIVFSCIVFLNQKNKAKEYYIESGSKDFKVVGELVLNGENSYLKIDSIKVLNKEKYQDEFVYDYSYYIHNGKEIIYHKNDVYGGFNNILNPKYSLIDSVERIEFISEYSRLIKLKYTDGLVLGIDYYSQRLILEGIQIPLKLEEK